MTRTPEELKSELDAALADRDRITKRASSIPARREEAAEALHNAKKAVARGDGGPAQIKEARATLHAIRDEEELAPYEVDAADERVQEAVTAHADAEFAEENRRASAEQIQFEAYNEKAAQFAAVAGQHAARRDGHTGRANRARQRGKDAADALARARQGRQTRKEQTLVDAGVRTHARQRRSSEVTISDLR